MLQVYEGRLLSKEWKDRTDITEILKTPACVQGKVRVRTTAGRAGPSVSTYLCVTVRGTMALSQVYCALYSPHSPKQLHLFLPSAISSSSHCIHLSVLLFKCSYSPFRRQITFKPTVTMATFACGKGAFEGTNEMCNNMHRHSASLSKNRTCKLLRHVTHAGWWGWHFHHSPKNVDKTLSAIYISDK